jgi:hypothetical protein
MVIGPNKALTTLITRGILSMRGHNEDSLALELNIY